MFWKQKNMEKKMNNKSTFIIIGIFCLIVLFNLSTNLSVNAENNPIETTQQKKGPKGGKLFDSGNFSLELIIYERGVPPQFRVFAYENDQLINPAEVKLSIQLKRLDGEVNNFTFKPNNNFLLGNNVVKEPHSFDVDIEAQYKDKFYNWSFESYEGRTEISEQSANEAGVKTEKAGPSTIGEYIRLMGRITLNRNYTAQVRARFPGIVKSVNVNWGQKVKKGDLLARVESNKSLIVYKVTTPVDGVITELNTNVGDVAGSEPLFTVSNLSEVWAEFHVFPGDLSRIKKGQLTTVYELNSAQKKPVNETTAPIRMLLPTANANSQTVIAIVPLDNSLGNWRPGMTVKGDVLVNEKHVPLAVKNSALQRFRDFTVVFAKYGNIYEVRMLELGLSNNEKSEVLSGLKPGTEYVTENSFLIKADIEKSGASHDH